MSRSSVDGETYDSVAFVMCFFVVVLQLNVIDLPGSVIRFIRIIVYHRILFTKVMKIDVTGIVSLKKLNIS